MNTVIHVAIHLGAGAFCCCDLHNELQQYLILFTLNESGDVCKSNAANSMLNLWADFQTY